MSREGIGMDVFKGVAVLGANVGVLVRVPLPGCALESGSRWG